MHSQLDVFLRGSRNYVQGTQLVARVGELVGAGGAKFVSATFSSITDRTVSAALRKGSTAAGFTIGNVVYSLNGDVLIFDLFEGAETAPRLGEAMNVNASLVEQHSKLWATYRFHFAESFEDLLNCIVQSTKALHEALGPTVYDVWLTGARGFALSLDGRDNLKEGLLRLRGGRCMRNGNQYQSLLRVELADCGGTAHAGGHVMFAFKSDEVIDVT